jgi:hypothetical protein
LLGQRFGRAAIRGPYYWYAEQAPAFCEETVNPALLGPLDNAFDPIVFEQSTLFELLKVVFDLLR